MSLDVYLNDDEGNCLYRANITHNLNKMADEAGIYRILWRPEEFGITKASEIVEPLSEGVKLLATQQSRFEQFNAENGWGMWEHFLLFCCRYLQACKDHPNASVEASR